MGTAGSLQLSLAISFATACVLAMLLVPPARLAIVVGGPFLVAGPLLAALDIGPKSLHRGLSMLGLLLFVAVYVVTILFLWGD